MSVAHENTNLNNFDDTLNILCSRSIQTESIAHCFVCCHFYNVNQTTLMNDLMNIDDSRPALNDNNLLKVFLDSNDLFNDNKNQNILKCTIKFIKKLIKIF